MHMSMMTYAGNNILDCIVAEELNINCVCCKLKKQQFVGNALHEFRIRLIFVVYIVNSFLPFYISHCRFFLLCSG